MATTQKIAILYGKLNITEQVVLANLVQHPGFKVLVKMFEQACEDATADVLKVNPEDANYERLLAATQQRSRSTHQFCERIRDSIQHHIDVARNLGAQVDPDGQQNESKGEN
jgi:hypothetical protein